MIEGEALTTFSNAFRASAIFRAGHGLAGGDVGEQFIRVFR